MISWVREKLVKKAKRVLVKKNQPQKSIVSDANIVLFTYFTATQVRIEWTTMHKTMCLKKTPNWKPQRPLYMPRAIFNFRAFRFAVIFLCFIVCARALVAAGFFLSLGCSVILVFLFGATDALPNG